MLERCPWYVAGPLLGLLMIGLRATLNKSFGALGGYVDVAENVTRPDRLGFRAYLLLGIVLGGALHSATSGTFALSYEYSWLGVGASMSMLTHAGVLLIAGSVMGFGARTAGGCTSGHGMSGMSLGSPASLVATMTFFATAVVSAQLMTRLAGAL